MAELHQDGVDLLCTDDEGLSALHHAARFGHRDVVKYLLESGPHALLELECREKGQRALHRAAWHRRQAICDMLIDAGASLLATDKSVCVSIREY